MNNDKKNKLRHLKNFDMFNESTAAAEPKVKPAKPTTKPETKPGRPSPFPTKQPSVDPKPKASAEQVASKFVNTANEEGLKNFGLSNDVVELLVKKMGGGKEAPVKPVTKPETKPGRPSPFPTKQPSVDPKPKAKKK